MSRVKEFESFRESINKKILSCDNLNIKRFFNLDSAAYKDGALPAKTKELMGLTASMVLRCDDCITYHLIQCANGGTTKDEFLEVFNVALIVGGSITIPHVRRAVEALEELGISISDEQLSAS